MEKFDSKGNYWSLSEEIFYRIKDEHRNEHIDYLMGNSSSGLLEAPTFKIPTINIGDRQKGRIKAKTVYDCKANQKKLPV